MPDQTEFISAWAVEVADAYDLHRSSAWMVADLIQEGLEEFDIPADQLIEMLAEQLETSAKTLSNYARVSKAFPPSKRFYSLEFSHHEAVVKYSEEERTRWLTLAAEQRWSVHRLRMEIRAGNGEEPLLLPSPIAAERLLYRMGIKANITKKKAKFTGQGFIIVVESDGELKWSGAEED